MTQKLYFIIAILCAIAGMTNTAQATTKTYIFAGEEGNTQTQFTGYFYAEDSPSTHYASTPSQWTYGTTGSLSFTLANGITLTLASSTNQLLWSSTIGFGAQGQATLTVSNSSYYIYHVRIFDSSGDVIQLDANGRPVKNHGVAECDYWNMTKSFTKTYPADGIAFKKIELTYATAIPFSDAEISGIDDSYILGDGAVEPQPTVTWHGTTLTKGTHYSLSYANNTADGTGTVTVTGIAPFQGTLLQDFTIIDLYLISDETTTISGVEESYTYLGSPVCPEPTVVCYGTTLTKGEHYSVEYIYNDKIGWAYANIIGINPYHGSLWKSFKINAALSDLVWVAGSYRVTEDMAYATISVTGDVTLTIDEGVTLLASNGITIAEDATLTFEGLGNLTVNGMEGTYVQTGANTDGTGGIGSNGSAGISGALIINAGTVVIQGGTGGKGGSGDMYSDGGLGGYGGTGISGSLTVNGGTVNVTGGTGGTGGHGGRGSVGQRGGTGGTGGTGGKGIIGSLTVNGGTVSITGGDPGSGGLRGSPGGKIGSPGGTGLALTGTVTCTAADHVIQESSNGDTWGYLASGSTSNKYYVRVVETIHLTLYDNADNTSAIASAAADGMPRTVTLQGRTFYRDGAWNTLCLPFDLNLSDSQLDAACMDVRELTGSSFDSSTGTLTLSFTEGETKYVFSLHIYMEMSDITVIEAGKPYLIRWGTSEGHPSTNLVDPVFTDVTLKSGTTDTATGNVTFCGTFDPISYAAADHSILFLGGENKLYWPEAGAHIGAFRAYFELGNGLTCGEPSSPVRAFNLGFGEGSEETGIISISKESRSQGVAGAWFDLNGRRLSGKPTARGIYVNNGRKVVVK